MPDSPVLGPGGTLRPLRGPRPGYVRTGAAATAIGPDWWQNGGPRQSSFGIEGGQVERSATLRHDTGRGLVAVVDNVKARPDGDPRKCDVPSAMLPPCERSCGLLRVLFLSFLLLWFTTPCWNCWFSYWETYDSSYCPATLQHAHLQGSIGKPIVFLTFSTFPCPPHSDRSTRTTRTLIRVPRGQPMRPRP